MEHIYKSKINQNVEPAKPSEFKPFFIGQIRVWPPVVLAPMAGVTNAPFRSICRRFGAGLYVSEMVSTRAFIEGNRKTEKLMEFSHDEKPRSLQLYGTDPHYVGEAVARLAGEGKVDHIDMNFGCPVPKITRKGGGSAVPLKPNLLRKIVRAAVTHAGDIPVTIKFRMGIDDRYQTYISSGKIAEEEGCAAVAMHARTAQQFYSGEARWDAIYELKQAVKHIPVLGNGNIWEAHDALRMMRTTGCDGVVIGRGCLGRPWLFRDLADVFEGREPETPPNLGEVIDIMLNHAELLIEWSTEGKAIHSFRKFIGWYLKGFHGSIRLRNKLVQANTLDELKHILPTINRDEPFPVTAIRTPRGKSNSLKRVILPDKYLDNLEDDTPPGVGTDEVVSGG